MQIMTGRRASFRWVAVAIFSFLASQAAAMTVMTTIR